MVLKDVNIQSEFSVKFQKKNHLLPDDFGDLHPFQHLWSHADLHKPSEMFLWSITDNYTVPVLDLLLSVFIVK